MHAHPHVAGYTRVSLLEQAREGVSLENQARKIELYCEMNDLALVELISDPGISAKNLNRPGIKKVLDMVQKKEIDAIVIYKLDRMFRSTIDALTTATMLDKNGIALHSINEKLDTQSAMGKFFFTLTASLAEMERNIIAERTRDAMQSMKQNGKSTGIPPYGFRLAEDGVHIEPDPDEQDIIQLMKEFRAQGLSFQKIADQLNTLGLTSRNGGPWKYQYVRGHIQTPDL